MLRDGSLIIDDLTVFFLSRLATKLWKPSSDTQYNQRKGGQRGRRDPPFLALASLHAGTVNFCFSVWLINSQRGQFLF